MSEFVISAHDVDGRLESGPSFSRSHQFCNGLDGVKTAFPSTPDQCEERSIAQADCTSSSSLDSEQHELQFKSDRFRELLEVMLEYVSLEELLPPQPHNSKIDVGSGSGLLKKLVCVTFRLYQNGFTKSA